MATISPADVADRYRLMRRIGSGGTGTVFQAADLLLGRTVAVKVLNPTLSVDLLRNEARSLASVHHPNIVGIHDLIEWEGRTYLIMEYVDGQDLDAWLAGRRSIGLAQALALFRQLAAAVAHAHARGLLHCDIKPANVLVSTTGDIKLTDFTLAQVERDNAFHGAAGGTELFAAPEQLHGQAVDRRTDVYGLGRLLLLLVRDIGDDSESMEDVREIITRAISLDPSERFPTVDALIQSLPGSDLSATIISSASSASELTRVRPVTFHTVTGMRPPKLSWKLAGTALAIVLLAAAILFRVTQAAAPARVSVPSLVSMDTRSAQLVVRSLDLRSRIILQYSDRVAAGTVLSQSPSAGSQIPHATVITMTVSRGPRPVKVPAVLGLSGEDGRSALRAGGFHVTMQMREDVFGTPDRVLAQSVSPGTLVAPHSTVTLTISKAPWWEFWR